MAIVQVEAQRQHRQLTTGELGQILSVRIAAATTATCEDWSL